jgi:hypothetical protein
MQICKKNNGCLSVESPDVQKCPIIRLADVLSVLLVYGLRLFDNFGKCDVLSVRPSQYSYVCIYIYTRNEQSYIQTCMHYKHDYDQRTHF